MEFHLIHELVFVTIPGDCEAIFMSHSVERMVFPPERPLIKIKTA